MKLKNIPDFEQIQRMALLAQKQWGVTTNQWRSVIVAKYKENIKQLAVEIKRLMKVLSDKKVV